MTKKADAKELFTQAIPLQEKSKELWLKSQGIESMVIFLQPFRKKPLTLFLAVV